MRHLLARLWGHDDDLKGRVAPCPTCQRSTAQLRDRDGWWVCQRCLNYVF